MSKLSVVRRKLMVARPRVAALGVAFAAVVGMSVTSVGTAYATGQACGGVDSNLANVCVHIDGGSNIVNDAIGQLQVTGPNGIGTWPSPASGNTAWIYYSGHIQVVSPTGKTLCNSITITLKHGAATSCESPNQGASPTGAYCTILWIWTGSEYRNGGQECMNVTK